MVLQRLAYEGVCSDESWNLCLSVWAHTIVADGLVAVFVEQVGGIVIKVTSCPRVHSSWVSVFMCVCRVVTCRGGA